MKRRVKFFVPEIVGPRVECAYMQPMASILSRVFNATAVFFRRDEIRHLSVLSSFLLLPANSHGLRAGYRLAFVSAQMIYSAGGQQLLRWCLVGTSGNFVGREPPDRITFGWLASIPFVSIGWKLRLTSNTLDRRDRSLEIAEAERGRVHQASVLRHNLPALP